MMIAFNLLQLISGGDDEGDCGDEHHGEGEHGEELCQLAGPRILDGVPGPGPPLAGLGLTKVLQLRLLQRSFLGLQVALLLALADIYGGVVL